MRAKAGLWGCVCCWTAVVRAGSHPILSLAAPLVQGARDRTPTRPGRAVGADARLGPVDPGVRSAGGAAGRRVRDPNWVGRVNRPAVTGRPVVWSAPDAQGTELAHWPMCAGAPIWHPAPRVPVAPGRRPRDVASAVRGRRRAGGYRAPLAGGPSSSTCGPTGAAHYAVELPAMAEYQRRAGAAVTVVTVRRTPTPGPVCNVLPSWGAAAHLPGR